MIIHAYIILLVLTAIKYSSLCNANMIVNALLSCSWIGWQANTRVFVYHSTHGCTWPRSRPFTTWHPEWKPPFDSFKSIMLNSLFSPESNAAAVLFSGSFWSLCKSKFLIYSLFLTSKPYFCFQNWCLFKVDFNDTLPKWSLVTNTWPRNEGKVASHGLVQKLHETISQYCMVLSLSILFLLDHGSLHYHNLPS